MEIKERRSTRVDSCDGMVEGVPPVAVLNPKAKSTFQIEPFRYRANFWWRAPDGVSGARLEIVGKRIRKDGSVGVQSEVRTWDLTILRSDNPDVPEWLRLVIDVDLWDRLPEYSQRLWAPNSHHKLEAFA